jgi:hypothetical protein
MRGCLAVFGEVPSLVRLFHSKIPIMADDETIKVASAAFIVLSGILKKKNNRRWWMTGMFKNRNHYSGSDLLCDLSIENTGQFKKCCRMSSEDFQTLIDLLGPKIQKRDTNFKDCIKPTNIKNPSKSSAHEQPNFFDVPTSDG